MTEITFERDNKIHTRVIRNETYVMYKNKLISIKNLKVVGGTIPLSISANGVPPPHKQNNNKKKRPSKVQDTKSKTESLTRRLTEAAAAAAEVLAENKLSEHNQKELRKIAENKK